jgi:hypothetical protein
MERLYARMPDEDGTEHDFGAKNAALAASLPPVERDILVASLVVTEMITRVGVGNVGEFPLRYEIRDGTP